ncbi:hypothetical protein B566_EDAN015032 [Ephemera danica]|nr:hypothetical protein B566_EDAN015032 [Ephemera danica]
MEVVMQPLYPATSLNEFSSSTPNSTESAIPGLTPVSISGGGLTLTWRNISVCVTKQRPLLSWGQKPETTQILRNVSGIARAGRLVAIMGASGAGKTTLLATISQRIKGTSSGEICVNGKAMSSEKMRHMSGFVPQQDLAVETLTVLEHMEFMARLKVSRSMRSSERQRWMRSLLSELGLSKCENTRLAALSGGERKRLSLAVQLLTDPPLLFCDEPTTGLDSYSAGAVVEKLRQLSLRGMAVICTIHQPASGIFDLFHDLILLAGGRVAYQGDVRDALTYFASKGLTCPSTYNAAEFYVSQLAIRPGQEERCMQQVTWLCDQFLISPEGQRLQIAIDEAEVPTDTYPHWMHQSGMDFPSYEADVDQVPWYSQLYWVIWRQIRNERRSAAGNIIRLIAFWCIGVVISVPFIGLKKDQIGVQNAQGLFYLIVVETIFTFAYSVYDTFPHEMPVLLREISDALYKPGPYYVSKMIMLIPRCIIAPFVYTLIVFCIVGLNGGIFGFITLCLPVMMCAASATAFGCMMSASFESISTASLVSVPIEIISLTLSGIFLKFKSLPMYLAWLPYISQFYYANEAVNILQWNQVDDIDCWDIPNAPCLHTGQEVLTSYGFSADHLFTDFLGLLGIYCFAHLVGFLSIRRRSKRQPIY